MEFKENKVKDPLLLITICATVIIQLFTAKLNPLGLVFMLLGFSLFLYAKLPNLKKKRYFTSGIDQIKDGYKKYYSVGMILMLFGFIGLFF